LIDQLGRMQVCTSLQTDNHTSTPPLCFLQARCPSCCPTNSIKALKALHGTKITSKLEQYEHKPSGHQVTVQNKLHLNKNSQPIQHDIENQINFYTVKLVTGQKSDKNLATESG